MTKYRKNEIIFAIKVDCFDLDEFLSTSLVALNSLVLIYNPYAGFELVRIRNGNKKSIRVIKLSSLIPSWVEGYYRELIAFPIVICCSLSQFFYAVKNYNCRYVFSDNTYIAGVLFPLSSIFLNAKLVYCAHDWFIVDFSAQSSTSELLRKFISWSIFRFFDAIATGLADLHYEYSKIVISLRSNSVFGGNRIKKKSLSMLGYTSDKNRSLNPLDAKNIVYFGSVPDVISLVEFLSDIKDTGFILHYAGNGDLKFFEDKFINFVFHGFLGDSELNMLFSNCAFGLCVGRPGSHSERVISSKFIDYLKHGVIPIVPEFMSEMFELVSTFSVGFSDADFKKKACGNWINLADDCLALKSNIERFRQDCSINQFNILFEELL